MATIIEKFIDPTGAGDYVTLSGWAADRVGNIVSRDTIEIASIRGGGSVGDVHLGSGHGWVTDEDHYIHIRAASGHEHPGCFDNTKAFINGRRDIPIFCQVGFTRIGPGISIYNNFDNPDIPEHPAYGMAIHQVHEDKPCVVDGLAIKLDISSVGILVEWCYGERGHFIKNCTIVGDSNPITAIRVTNAKATVYNCALISNGGIGLQGDNDGGVFEPIFGPAAPGIVISENNYISATSGYVAFGSGSFFVKGQSDVTSTNEAVNPSYRNIAYQDAGFLNPFAGSGTGLQERTWQDLHLIKTSFLRGKGVDLRENENPEANVLTDMDGFTRPETPDVGALQFKVPQKIIKTIKPSGGDYTTINAWEQDRRGNLARRNSIEIAEIYSGTNNVGLRMLAGNWGVNLQSYPVIRAATGHSHSGVFDANKAYIKNSTSIKEAIFCTVGHTHIGPGLSIENSFYTGVSEDPYCIRASGLIRGGPFIIEQCCLKNAVEKNNTKMVKSEICFYDPSFPHIIKNCQIFTAGGDTTAQGLLLHGSKWKVYNNIIYTFGSLATAIISDGGELKCENNYIACNRKSYDVQGGGTIIKGFRDATQNDEALNPSLSGILRINSVFLDADPIGYPNVAPNNYLPLGSPLRASGINLSNQHREYLSVVKDIRGKLRTVPYDIGAFEATNPGEESVSTDNFFVLF